MLVIPEPYFVQETEQGERFLVNRQLFVPEIEELVVLVEIINQTILERARLQEICINFHEQQPPYKYVPKQRAKPTKAGQVYLVKYNGFYKIGKSVDAKRRIKEFSNIMLPEQFVLIGYIESNNYETLEKELHHLFRHARIRGEWFRLTDQDVAMLKCYEGWKTHEGSSPITLQNKE